MGNNTWLRMDGSKGEWAISYHGPGLHDGATMAAEGFTLSKGECGVYSTNRLDVAFLYAATFEHGGKRHKVVVQNRVGPWKVTKYRTKVGGMSAEFWVVPSDEDIRPYGLICRVEDGLGGKTRGGEGGGEGKRKESS